MTLIEILLAASLTIMMMSAAMSMLEIGAKSEPKITERANRISEGRTAIERMTRELRSTYQVRTTGATTLDFLTSKRSTACPDTFCDRHLRYECDAGQCTRQEGSTTAELSGGVKVIDGLTNIDIFSYEPNNLDPEYVRIRFVFAVKNQSDPVTLEDGVNLRNATNYDD